MKEKKIFNLDRSYLNQVALSSDDNSKDTKFFMDYLNELIKIISTKMEGIERENKLLSEKESKFDIQLKEKDTEINNLQSENEKLKEEMEKLQERYEKEQKKANLLEVENNRNLDELKRLRKERNELKSKVEKASITLKDKLKNIMK